MPGMDLRHRANAAQSGTDPRQGNNIMSPRQGTTGMEPRLGGFDPRQSRTDPRQQGAPGPRLFTTPQQQVGLPPMRITSQEPLPPLAPSQPNLTPSAPPQPNLTPFQPSLESSSMGVTVPALFGSLQQQPPLMEKTSPAWGASAMGMSPEHRSSPQRPNEGSAMMESRRVDPRTKYAHLKIKSKGQSASPQQPSGAHSILKKTSSETRLEMLDRGSDRPPFVIPKLLQDPTTLDKPLDPGELFGGSTSMEPEDITTPFGSFRSFFTKSETAVSATGAQQFGEITLQDKQSEENVNPQRTKLTEGQDSQAVARTPETSAPETKQSVPSYLAALDLGLDEPRDLKIDSAFGSLGETSKEGQKEGAKKLPSIFGFGSF